ncbi:MAG: hypothetical protein IJ176_02565 [Prevotella sp.]|nr:hypothetical protein [Prevotella sp.]
MMNQVILNGSLPFGSQVSDTDTIYVIMNDFTISESVTVGENSILRFNGGSLSGCTAGSEIQGNNIRIESPLVKIFNGISFKGDFLNGQIFEIEWFVDTFETSFLAGTTKDAHDELQSALNSGVKIMRFNNERYYPICSTITVNGDLDIIGWTRYLDSTYKFKQPCIYSLCVATLFEYNFISISHLPKTRLDINGLNFYCATSNASQNGNNARTGNVDTPIVRINNMGTETLWGLHVDVNITSVNNETTKQPNWTGLEINGVSGSITFIEIHGYVSSVYRAYKINAGAHWVSDTKIFGNSMCVLGGVFNGGHPVRNYGSHQPLGVFSEEFNGESYFKARQFENYGYVWDVGEYNTETQGWSCCYIASPLDEGKGFTYDDSQQKFGPVGVEMPTDVFYPNLLADAYKYRNGLTDITVNTVVSHKVGGVDVFDNLPFKRYEFPAHLMRSDNLAYHAAFHSDASFAWLGNNNIKYKYKTTIVFSGQTMRLASQDNPPLYLAPILAVTGNNTINGFEVVVNYKDENGVLLKTLPFHFSSADEGDCLSSPFRFGKYVKIRNIFLDGRTSNNSTTEIIYTEHLENQALVRRPVFFIPNYHADKIIRAGGDNGMVAMTEYDVGETYYHTSRGQLWWNGSKWTEYDGANASVRRSGTFAQRPTTGIYVGFRYFCTSGASVQGTAMTNIEIFYTGASWVDALGRTVS